jgi:pilus assembly protein Flp/PilA
MIELLRRLLVEEEGQGIVEYALILGLVVFGIWVAIKTTDIGTTVSALFTNVKKQVEDCSSGDCGGK